MNLSSLFASLLQPLILKPLNKGATWLARQTAGPAKGNQFLAANAPAVNAVENSLSSVVAGSLAQSALSQVGAAHLTTDKLAKSLGIPTTEEVLIAAGVGQAEQAGVLNLSDPAAALGFLAANLVK